MLRNSLAKAVNVYSSAVSDDVTSLTAATFKEFSEIFF
jgi:hypothetical protein